LIATSGAIIASVGAALSDVNVARCLVILMLARPITEILTLYAGFGWRLFRG
jgi:hypothetical protein